jgi:adenylylsulfate kinase
MAFKRRSGYVVWFTGLAGSGKTTYAKRIAGLFKSRGSDVEILDGDLIRKMFEGDLGFHREDRIRNIRRITNIAEILSRHGVTVIVANIAPYYEARDFIRKRLKRYIQIYLHADIETLKKRPKKDFYFRAEKGLIKNVIGLDDPYDTPRRPDIVIDTRVESIKNGISRIAAYLKKKDVLG